MKVQIIAVIVALFAGEVSAQGWSHTTPAPGQFEGSFEASGGDYGLDYACSEGKSQIGLRADGLHVAAGESTLSVDGVEVAKGNTTYNSKWDATSFTRISDSAWGEELQGAQNAMFWALARGNEAAWTTPTGQEFVIDLTGSADIKNCTAAE